LIGKAIRPMTVSVRHEVAATSHEPAPAARPCLAMTQPDDDPLPGTPAKSLNADPSHGISTACPVLRSCQAHSQRWGDSSFKLASLRGSRVRPQMSDCVPLGEADS